MFGTYCCILEWRPPDALTKLFNIGIYKMKTNRSVFIQVGLYRYSQTAMIIAIDSEYFTGACSFPI